jgi:hypothetical protein
MSSADLEKVHQRELYFLRRAHDSGVEAAALEAFKYCREHRVVVPAWVANEMERLALASLLGSGKKRGRTAGPAAAHRNYMKHYRRWDQVVMIREKQGEIRERVEELEALEHPPQKILAASRALLRRLGRSWPDAFRCASNELLQTDAHGDVDAIAKSYKRVQRATRTGKNVSFYTLLPRLQRELNVDGMLETRRRGTK